MDSTGSVVALAAGDIILNTPYYFIYDGTRWVLVGGGSTLGAGLTYDSVNSILNVGGNTPPELNGSSINLVGADGVSPFFALWAFGNNGPVINTYRAKGTHGTPTGVVAGTTIGLWRSLGYDAVSAAYWPNAYIKMVSTETWDDANEGTEVQVWTTPIGSVSQQQDLTINSSGLNILTGETYNINGVPHTHTITIGVGTPGGSAIGTGDEQEYYRIPPELNGKSLSYVAAHVSTVSSSGIPTFQVRNVTTGHDMLSTPLTIDQGEKDSKDATTPVAIDPTYKTVSTGDEIAFDVDIAGTGAKGLKFQLFFS
jgi:hypothetical protein